LPTATYLADQFYDLMSTTTSTGKCTSASWTTTSEMTDTWLYYTLDPVHSDMDTSITTANITVSNLIWRVRNEAFQQSLAMGWELTDHSPPGPRIFTPAELEAQLARDQERQSNHEPQAHLL
jgi:hypothetical protein